MTTAPSTTPCTIKNLRSGTRSDCMRSLYRYWTMLPLYVTTIALPRLHALFRMGASIRRQRSTDVHFLVEMPFIVSPDIPLVALVRFDQFSFRHHDVLL